MENLWYALQEAPDDDWGNGTENREEAEKMLAENEKYNLIAVIDGDLCIEEIWKDGAKEAWEAKLKEEYGGRWVDPWTVSGTGWDMQKWEVWK